MHELKALALSALLDDPDVRSLLSSERAEGENFFELLFRLQDRLFENTHLITRLSKPAKDRANDPSERSRLL